MISGLPVPPIIRAPKYVLPCSEPWKDPFRNIARGWESIPWTLWLRMRFGLFGSGVISCQAREGIGLSETLPFAKVPLVANAHPL